MLLGSVYFFFVFPMLVSVISILWLSESRDLKMCSKFTVYLLNGRAVSKSLVRCIFCANCCVNL